MADPATQFQQASLQASGYSPVRTELAPPIQLPGTGELWAKVGQTAMNAVAQAGEMLQKSPLNPAVRAQMNFAIANYKAGQEHIAKTKGGLGTLAGSVSPSGYTQAPLAGVTDPTMATQILEKLGLMQGSGGGGGGPEVNAGAQPAQPATQPAQKQQGFEASEYPPTTQSEAAPSTTQPQPKGPPTAGEMGKSASIFSRPSAAAPSPDQIAAALKEAQQRNQFASSEQGIPAGYQPPQPQSQTPAAATQADQAAMQKWQEQNAHPVMSSQDALAWMKAQTTLAQDATYLPNGGPGGSPAYAFHMKGGGINTVPVSQMIQKGAGPVVAAQNTSAVLSKSDQISNPPQPGAQGQPPAPQADQGQGPPPAPTGPLAGAQGQPPAAQAVQGQSPAAPGITDIYGNPLGAYTNVASRGGPTLANLTAQTAPAGQPAQPGERPGGQLINPPADTTLTPQERDTVQSQANNMGAAPTGKYTGDRKIPGTKGPYTYYRNEDPTSPSFGRAYTVLPGPAGQYYNQRKWYLGTNTYDTYELPDSDARATMWEKWGKTGFLTREEVDKMPPEQMQPWLKRAWENENLTRSSPVEGLGTTLDTSEEFHNTVKIIEDIVQTIKKNGLEADLNSIGKNREAWERAAESIESTKPAERQGILERGGTRLAGYEGALAGMDRNTAEVFRALEERIGHAQDLLKKHPELMFNPGKTEGLMTPNINTDWANVGLPNIPPSNVLSDVWSGQDIDSKLNNLNLLQKVGDTRYKDLVNQAHDQWLRIADKHQGNTITLDQGRNLPGDKDNPYRNQTMPRSPLMSFQEADARIQELTDQVEQMKKQIPGSSSANAQPSATPSEPLITNDADYNSLSPGAHYRDRNGGLHQKPLPPMR